MRFYKTTISLLLFIISIHIHAIDKEDVFFKHITVDDGLSNNSAICFNQDTSGLIWIGTNDGLNMYNSAEFRIFRHNTDDSTTLSNNRIKSIDFDADNNLWVGTEEGLNLFVSDIFQFKRFYCDTAEKKELLTNNINIVFPYNEKVFLGTDRGIKILEKGENSFTHYQVEGLEKDGIKNVTVIKEDSRKNLWVGTESGLFYYNQDFELIATFPEIDRVAWGNTIVEDDRKNIWVCTANGIYKITNINNGSYKLYHSGNELSASKNISFSGGAKDDNSNLWLASGAGLHMVDDQENWTLYTAGRAYGKLNDNYIRSVFFDKEGNMWVGTDAGGINLYYKYRKKFKYLTVYQEEGKRLLSNKTKGIYADKNGFIWIGTEGLNRYNPETGSVKYWKDINKIISIIEDKSSNIWVATEKGVYRINQNREIVKHYEMNSRVPGANYIHDLHITSEGHLLAATWGGGLWILKSPETGFQPITHTGKHNGLDHVKYIYEDRDKQLWLGNDIGIFKLNKNYKPVFSISNNNEKPESLNGSYTYCMYQDIEGNYWVGTNRGLQCYNPEKKTISNFGRKNGFRNEVILGILEDKENNLWLTTYSGLIKFNRLDSTVRVFTSKDGLISNQFSQGSVATSPVNQNLYLGSLE
jgi:ligand-binding sensor domain-containing protein